jgi:hypothetical protein
LHAVKAPEVAVHICETMPTAKKSETSAPVAGVLAIRSPAGFELLARPRIVGWPTFATPWRTLSMKLGWAVVPDLAMKTWAQLGPHCGVAAVADRGGPHRADAADHGQCRRGSQNLAG